MMPLTLNENEGALVPPPAYHRVQAQVGPVSQIDAFTLVTTLP